MELAQITAGQVVMLFLLMGTGIAAVKTGVLKPEGKQTLSNLLVYLVVPAMIVNSYRMEFNMEILHNLLAAFGMSLLALLIGTGITLALIAQPLELMANMTTPLSMVITGMLLAAGDLGCIVRSKPVWKLAAVRMLLIPAVCLAVFGLLGFRSMTAQVVLLLECCPSAAITSVFAVQFGHDESFAAGSVVLTTLLSIVALPLCALVVTLL